LRALQLQTVRGQLQLAEQDDALVRPEDVVQERLIEPDRADGAGAVAEQQLEDLEARPAGRADAAADDLADDRRGLAGPQLGDRLEMAAVLIADGKPVEEVFDSVKTDTLEIGGAPRADTLQVLQRRLERVYCTTIASPLPTRISLIRAGSSNGSSMPIPLGFSAVRE